jgi:hypothetical protein
MDCTQVGVLEETNKVGLACFLQGKDGRSLESKVTLEILGNLTYQTLEWCLFDEEVGRLLVSTDLTEGDSSGTITVGLLHTSCVGAGLTCCLGASCLRGALPPVDLRAVCLVRAMVIIS